MEVGTSDKSEPTTPASTATAVLDAPASTTPSAPKTADTAIREAFKRAEAVPSTASPAATGVAVSATQPGPSTTATAVAPVTKTEEPIPLDRHKTALENARTKAIEDYRAKVGWAENLTKQDVDDALALVKALDTEDGQRAALAKLQQALKPTADTSDPEPDLVSQDGQHTAFSATAMRKIVANVEARVTAKIMAQLQPTVAFATHAQAESAQSAIIGKAQTFAKSAYADLAKLPWFTRETHGEPIAAAYAAIPAEEKATIGVYAALMKAANTVYIEQVWPALQSRAETSVLTDLQRKAAASTGTVTGAAQNARPAKRPETHDEIAAMLAAKFAAR